MRGPVKPFLFSMAVIAMLVALLWWPEAARHAEDSIENDGGASPLLFYCAAGIRKPVAAALEAYRQEYGVDVRLDFAGSGTLLSKLEVAQKGDLYLAGDASYIALGRERGLLAEAIPLAHMTPVIVVSKGNPKGIAGVADLARDDVRTAMGAPEAASISKQSQRLLESLGHWTALEVAVRDHGVFKPTVNEVANDVKLGAVDAGVVWDATAGQYPELESLAISGTEDFAQEVTVSVVAATKRPAAALRLARYLAARDKGLLFFEQEGFKVTVGDVWEETPEILYFSGGVNRVAIEDTLKAFQAREGCVIKTVYNGCGILVGQMKLGERPDVYHSCDISFMRDIAELFDEAVQVSRTDLVIVTAKGNPKAIRSLTGLGDNGLRVGLANEQQSALGALTARLLREESVYDAVQKNVVANTPTADLLVNQISTGALDAVVVYEANMNYQKDNLDIIAVDLPLARAIQTYAVSTDTKYPRMMARLLAAIESEESTLRYRETGFQEASAP